MKKGGKMKKKKKKSERKDILSFLFSFFQDNPPKIQDSLRHLLLNFER